jgi:hypothetical protein
MTVINPNLAARIAAKGVPLSADWAPPPATPRWHQLRTELIRTFSPYMRVTVAAKATDLLDEVIAEALLEGTAKTHRADDIEFGVVAVQPGEDFETFFVCDSRTAAEQQIADYGDVYRSCRLVQRDGRYGTWTGVAR